MKLSQRYFELKESGLLLLKKLNKVGALREETHFGREYNDSYKDLVNLVVDTTNIVNTILKNLRHIPRAYTPSTAGAAGEGPSARART